MNRPHFLTLFALLAASIFVFSSTTPLAAQEKAAQEKPDTDSIAEQTKDDKSSDDKEPAVETTKTETVTAELKPFVVYKSFDGVFESTRTEEIKTDFKTWTDLKIESVVEEGAAVSADQELLKLDTESIGKAVSEAEFEAKNTEFDLEAAKLEMKQINETIELDREIAERARKNAQEDFEYYRKISLPQRLKDLDYTEKTAAYFLEYSKDELDQLEQMYTEDELTEESEEIVLKRARRSVESAERSRDRTMVRVKRERELDVPRESIRQEQAFKRQELSYERSTITMPIKKQETEIALAKAEFTFKNKQKHLDEIRADQQNMTLSSPRDGVLYYGRCVRGKWLGTGSATARRLEPNKKVAANTVIMTIVDINQMMIRASLEESNLDSLAPRLRGKALIKSAGNTTIPVMIKSVSKIPLDDGKFDCQILIENLPAITIMPGMGCKLSFLVHEQKQAVVVPKASVFSDDNDVTHYVYVLVDEKPKRKQVRVGQTSGDDVEIVDGLTEGDKITKAKP